MTEPLQILFLLAAAALFLVSFCYVLIAFGRAHDLESRLEAIIRSRYPQIAEGRIPRARAIGRFDLSCDYAYEYAIKKGLLADRPDLIAEYKQIHAVRDWSLLGMFIGALVMALVAV